MSRPSIFQVKVADLATPRLENLALALQKKGDLHAEIGTGVELLVKRHFRNVNAPKGNKLGGLSTHFWSRAADAVRVESSADRVDVVADQTGVSLQYYGGTLYPSGKPSTATGKPIQKLTIPIAPEAHGKRAIDFGKGNLSVFRGALYYEEPDARKLREKKERRLNRGRKGRWERIEPSGKKLFILARRATVPPHPEVMPTDEQVTESASRYAAAYFQRITAAP